MSEITVLPDKSLGGVKREYRSVARKARVGERIKIVDAGYTGDSYGNGAIFIVNGYDGRSYVTVGSTFNDGSELIIEHEEYVVLEPTDVIRIEDSRYRMVGRKADVGESVIIVDVSFPSNYDLGEVFTVDGYVWETDKTLPGIIVSELKRRRGGNINGFVKDGKYRVLEPIDSEKPSLSDSARIAELESRVTEIETQLDGVLETIANIGVNLAELRKGVGSGAIERKSIARETIVERAKADVADLRKFAGVHVPDGERFLRGRKSFWPCVDGDNHYVPLDRVEYVFNRDKRTVVALISDDEGVWARGIAKCAPGDVYNVHIGKAIALRRALGLAVPDEYVNAPQPTEARVGDVVIWESAFRGCVRTTLTKRRPSLDCPEHGKAFLHSDSTGWLGDKQFRIIDDSRCEADGTAVSA